MKKYEDMIKDLKQYTDLNDATSEFYVREMCEVDSVVALYNSDHENIVTSIDTMANSARLQCNNTINERRNFVILKVNEMKRLLSFIKDPHYHRMETKYSRQVHDNRTIISDMEAEELMRKAEAEMDILRENVGRLNQAFIPAGVSNAIGVVVRPYRKSTYMSIITSRNKVLDYIEPLLNTEEITLLLSEIDEAKDTRLSTEQSKLYEQLATIPEIRAEKVQNIITCYNQGLVFVDEQSDLFSTHAIMFGAYVYNTSFMNLFADTNLGRKEGVVLGNEAISFPVGYDSLRNNYIYMYSGENKLQKHYTSLAVEMLSENMNNEVIFVDVKGLGSGYALMNKLTNDGHVKIWSTSAQVSAGLDELENWISTIYAENLADRYNSLAEYNAEHSRKKPEKYIFINDLKGNVEQREYERLARIIKNGCNAGVYVIVSATTEDIEDRYFCNLYSEVQAYMAMVETRDMTVQITNNSYIVLKCSIERDKIDALKLALINKNELNEIVPLAEYLPARMEDWHRVSAAKEIAIPFGIDSNGRVAIFKISSEKPYGMIIGDPRHGKSKLMHTIIMMITSRYSEEEVKIAVMDLKDGAEFNIYAKAGVKPVECVLNDEDPDAMLSFLRYYVSEMHRRQLKFEELEDKAGVIIQKYEDYRTTNEDLGNVMSSMPRIVLLIDEFQTLFDGAASATYMSELVRKGATYGIHVILSSQRAVSSNPRNGFTADLKDYFTSRFVFKCPQAAARTVLSERCADTSKENSGIHKASLLSKGHVIYNSYMGQNEADNLEVQCFYPAPDTVSQFVNILEMLKGGSEKILCRKNSKSGVNTSKADGRVYLGDSVRIHHDLAVGSEDYIKDDMTISFSMDNKHKNMIVTGTDTRCVDSIVTSFMHYAEVNKRHIKLNVYGRTEELSTYKYKEYFSVFKFESLKEQLDAMSYPSSDSSFVINLVIEPDTYEEYVQSPGGIRKSPGAEALKGLLDDGNNTITIIYTKNFRNLRSSLQYVLSECPIHIAAVGDSENVRMSMSENIHIVPNDFDIPRKDAIKAYYYNKHTEKYGKVILYCG